MNQVRSAQLKKNRQKRKTWNKRLMEAGGDVEHPVLKSSKIVTAAGITGQKNTAKARDMKRVQWAEESSSPGRVSRMSSLVSAMAE